MGVHLFGQPFNLKAILEICEDHNLILIEDCAQAHGAEFDGKKVGGFGVGCFSFYATKNMTTAEGGMITCSDEKVFELCKLLRSHGESSKYNHEILGHNMRMTNIQAAIGLIQLRKLEWMNGKRRENASFYNKKIKVGGLREPKENYGKHVYHQYVLYLEDEFPMTRDEFSKYLAEMALAKLLAEKGLNVGVYDEMFNKGEVEELGLKWIKPEEADIIFDCFELKIVEKIMKEIVFEVVEINLIFCLIFILL